MQIEQQDAAVEVIASVDTPPARKPRNWTHTAVMTAGLMLVAFGIAWAAQTNFLGVVFIADPTTPSRQMTVNADGSINTTGSATLTNPTVGAAVPATANYVAGNKGGLLTGVTLDGSSNLNVNCVVGCAGGTFNNNADAVATSATNGQTAAWLYGWNGASFDRLQVDGSKFLKVNCASGCAGGSFNNNADAVATSATNGQTAAWLYGFNGATWDRLQVDASKFLKVNATNLPATVDTNSGVKSASTLRVVLATDQPALTNKLLVTPDSVALPANQSVNVSQINAVTPLMGNGVTGTGSLRVTLSSDNTSNSNPFLVNGNVTPADAKALGTTSIGTYSYSGVYNGTTIDLMRELANSTNSVGTGILASGQLGQCDDTAPTALTENSFGNAALDCTNHTQLIGGLVTTAAPSYTTATSRGASLTTAGALRGDINSIASNTVLTGNGVTGTGSIRVTLASDNTSNTNAFLVNGNVTPADAKALGTTSIGTYSYTGIYNGTTIDLLREVSNSMNTTGVGIPVEAIAGQCDDTSPTALTENSWGNGRIDCATHAQVMTAVPSATAGGTTLGTITAANSTNATNLKASAGQIYGLSGYTITATAAWVSFYNTAGTPTCGTGIIEQYLIPGSASGAGFNIDFAYPHAYATGIGYCITTGIAGTGSVAATSYVVNFSYK